MAHSKNGGEEQSVGKVMGEGNVIGKKNGRWKWERWVQKVLLNRYSWYIIRKLY